MAILEPSTMALALLVIATALVLGWDWLQMDRAMRAMRVSYERSSDSRAFRDGGRS